MPPIGRGFLVLAAAMAVGCDDPRPRGWRNQPIPITVEDNIPMVELLFDGHGPLLAAIASGSPLTVVDIGGSSTIRTGDLRLQDGAHPDVTRFLFFEQEIIDRPVGRLGLEQGVEVQGLVGWTVLSRLAIDLRYGESPELIMRDNIPDKDTEIASDCDPGYLLTGGQTPAGCAAVVGSSPAGGGLGSVGGETVQLPATRLVVPVCIAPAAFDPKGTKPEDITTTGQPANAVVATELGTSIISRSAFERLIASDAVTSETTPSTLHLPYGEEAGSIAQLPGLALVHNETRDFGPCGELARRQRLLLAGRSGILERDEEKNGTSAVVLTVPLTFVVVDDNAPILVGLRSELRPTFADIDLVLGGSVLSTLRLTLDYPSSRLIVECDPALPIESCRVLPHCAAEGGDGPPCRP